MEMFFACIKIVYKNLEPIEYNISDFQQNRHSVTFKNCIKHFNRINLCYNKSDYRLKEENDPNRTGYAIMKKIL